MKQLDKITIGIEASIREAMQAIDLGAIALALVVDEEGRMLGTVTDGDIRRALLGDATLDHPMAPYYQRAFTSVNEGTTRNEVLDLMKARTLSQVPILDAEGRLVGLHLLRQFLGSTERPNWAVILAGGLGTRLGPLTENMPKPMLKVAGRPIMERLVLHLLGYGIKRIFLAVNYLADNIIDHFKDGSDLGCRIDYLKEDQPLGTAGSLGLLPTRPDHPVLVMNGDLLVNFNVAKLLDHHADQGAAITMGVTHYTHQVPFGVAQVEDGAVQRLEEKPVKHWLINAAIYVVEPAIIETVSQGKPLTMPELIQRTMAAEQRVAAYEIGKKWADIGTPTELRRARGQDL